MIASHASHSQSCSSEIDLPLFMECANSIPLYVKDALSRHKESKRIVSLSEDIVWIEGTVSVAF